MHIYVNVVVVANGVGYVAGIIVFSAVVAVYVGDGVVVVCAFFRVCILVVMLVVSALT